MPITSSGRATDFITFTRTSNATVTDSNGFIKWAGHNLLTNSESFDASSWTKNAVTVAANSVAAPNGTTTADTATETIATDLHAAFQSVDLIAGGVTYTFTVFAKANTRTHAMLRIGGGSFGTGPAIRASLSGSGSVTTLAGTVASSSISLVGDSWYLISMTFASGSSATHLPQCGPHDGGSATTYTGDITKSVYLWGAHLYRSDLGGMVLNPARGDAYYPTTPRNLLGFTEDFSNAAWDKSSFGTSATSNTLIAPNGLQTADLITAINSTNNHLVYQSSGINLAASGVVTGSIYVKADTSTFVRLGVVDNLSGADWAGFIVNLSTGAVTNTYTGANASNVTTHTPVSVGNGWYRVGITATLTASTNDLTLRVGPFNAASASPGNYFSVSWAAVGTESIYLWGAQLSDSASLDTYSPVYGAAVTSAAYYAPRLDYSGSSLAALGLLVEEQRTNLVLHTAAFDNAYWGKTNLNTSGTPSWVDVGLAPDGTTTAEKLIPNTTTGFHFAASDFVTGTGSHTMSVFAKGGEYTRFALREMAVVGSGALFDLTAGTVLFTSAGVTATITPVGNNWYRCTASLTWGTSYKMGVVVATNTTTADLLPSFAGNGTDGLFVWGAQLEASSFATSYIPTGASTATRAADAASLSTQAIPYSANLSIVVNAMTSVPQAASKKYLIMGNSIPSVAMDTTTVAGELPNIATIAGLSASYTTNTPFKAGFAFSSGNSVLAFNGTVSTTSTVASTPATSSEFVFGRNYIGNIQNINGYIRQVTVIPRRLSNSELQARTA